MPAIVQVPAFLRGCNAEVTLCFLQGRDREKYLRSV